MQNPWYLIQTHAKFTNNSINYFFPQNFLVSKYVFINDLFNAKMRRK